VTSALRSRWSLAAALGLLTLATRLPFMPRTLYSYDAANYAFALRDYYNVAHHQPHPPGYPLYVAAAKLFDVIVRDPNTSLVLLSTLAAAGAVSLTCVLGARMFGSRVGVFAGLLLTFTVGFWGYSEVAYPYTSLAFWLVVGALLCLSVRQGRASLALPLGVALGVAAGFRWDAPFFLGPLWLWAIARCGWRERLLSIAAFVAVCVAWFVPMALLSGGLNGYLEALRLQSEYIVGTYSLASGGRAILEFNLSYLVAFFRQMYGLSLLLVLYALGRLFTPRRLATDFRVRFLLVWMLPALLIYFTVHIGEPGYLLSLAPVLALVGAVVLAELDDELRIAAQVLAVRWRALRAATLRASTASRNSGRASFAPPSSATVSTQVQWSRPTSSLFERLAEVCVPLVLAALVAYQTNAFLTSPGPARLPELQLIDATQTAQYTYVRERAAPGEAIVLAHDRFRQAQFELSGYDVRLLFDEYAQGWLEGRLWTIPSPLRARTLFVLDPLDATAPGDRSRGREVVVLDSPRVVVWEFDLLGADSIEHGYQQVHIRS
jgi:hypothetical protein